MYMLQMACCRGILILDLLSDKIWWNLGLFLHKHNSPGMLLDQYGVNKTALTLDGEEYEKKALITTEVLAEWTTFRHYLAKQPKEDMASQLNNLLTTEMLKTMFPHLNTLANVCMTIPVGTASVERSFSQMKMIKLV